MNDGLVDQLNYPTGKKRDHKLTRAHFYTHDIHPVWFLSHFPEADAENTSSIEQTEQKDLRSTDERESREEGNVVWGS